MAKVESTVTIARPVEEVFRFFLDVDTNACRTDPNVESVTRTPDGPTRPGTTFHFRHRVLGRIRETTTTFISLDPNRKIEIEARVGPLRPKGCIAFATTPLGTVVAVRLNPDPYARSSCSRRSSPESGRKCGTRGWRGSNAPLSCPRHVVTGLRQHDEDEVQWTDRSTSDGGAFVVQQGRAAAVPLEIRRSSYLGSSSGSNS